MEEFNLSKILDWNRVITLVVAGIILYRINRVSKLDKRFDKIEKVLGRVVNRFNWRYACLQQGGEGCQSVTNYQKNNGTVSKACYRAKNRGRVPPPKTTVVS